MALILRSLSVTYGDGHVVDSHAHRWGQLVYAASGAIRVSAEQTEWLVPPARAVWLPPMVRHSLGMRGIARLRTIYLSPELVLPLPQHCCGLEISALLRELILHIVRAGPMEGGVGRNATLGALLVDLLAEADTLPFQLRLPSDPRARRAASRIRRSRTAQSRCRSWLPRLVRPVARCSGCSWTRPVCG